ncbi:MAG TPA: acyl-CoA desaturase [Chloroflexota bacterium]|nr:acyl-CoA desaturase [Chloroflexota bacterium]
MKHAPRFNASAYLGKVITLVAVFVPLMGAGYAVAQLWQRQVVGVDLVLLATMYFLTGFGITVGFHRFATHRSFKTSRPVEFVLLALGTMAVEGQVLQWVATHSKHHRLSDKPGDPHSPLEVLFHAHIGWMLDNKTKGVVERDAKHQLNDPVAVFIHRTFLVWIVLGLVIPFLVDGWRGLVWGGLVRIFLTHHTTWSVNSICHQFGRRAFDTADESRNEWVVGLVGLGEGWHNNHHAFPESAYHGLRWYEVDLSGYVIRGLQAARLIHDVRRPSAVRIARRRLAQSESLRSRRQTRPAADMVRRTNEPEVPDTSAA